MLNRSFLCSWADDTFQHFVHKGDQSKRVQSADVIKLLAVICITVFIILGNVFCLFVLNSRRTRRHLPMASRMLMTSLACTDCSMGVFVTSLSAYPAIHGCWPFGDSICMWQVILKKHLLIF